jgi:ribosomal-protein-alanine N-acetyltransferase
MELTGSGFVLRPWQLGDALSLQQHANNFNVSAYLLDHFPFPYTLPDAVSWLNSQLQNPGPTSNFAITINGKAVGGIGMEFRHDVYRKTSLIGYWLSEDYWGRGIMPQAVKLMTDYAFANLDLICIQAGVLSANPKSMRVLEKAGYEKQGVLRKCVIKRGEVMDEHVYAAFIP